MANYTFTQPIRYYKANDPYYYEVDNIPLRQLEENILYVKGLIEGVTNDPGSITGGLLNTNSELDITMIKQLRPKIGGGRQVVVNAGLFNSRINDAFDISKALGKLVLDSVDPGDPLSPIPNLQFEMAGGLRDAIFDRFTTTAAASKSYNINGLEFAYTFYSSPGKLGGNWGWNTGSRTPPTEGSENYPKYDGVDQSNEQRWPGYSNFGPLAGASLAGLINSAGFNQVRYEAQDLPDIHQAFVKMWRGVFRTAVVDFPESVITIPEWNDEDFYYYDENDEKVTITADQRIDLLVAYSVPVDSSGTALQDYETGFANTGSTPSPKRVTQPVLGLYKGAGIGIQKSGLQNISTHEGVSPDTPPPGSARIVGNVSDKETGANQGITDRLGNKIHGSFPSPDDLLNIAPLIALDVDADDLQLVGQTALPIAYIVVKKDQNIITQDDIIDIRPFLRTTEFTYNERAGVAAANPPLSFANPAVGAYQLKEVVAGLNQKIGSIPPPQTVSDGQALYTDYVMGGLAYGVEGTLLTMCDYTQGPTDPFGSQANTTYTNPQTGTQYNLNFTSSKQFLESQDTTLREAYLQYLVEQRQTNLKRWLSDPNSPGLGNQTGSLTYLGLPQGNTGRNIPVFPEWDIPADGNNTPAYFNITPKVTWWMHFEATTNSRSLAYVPGGVASSQTANGNNYMNRLYEFGTGDERYNAKYNVCSKKIQITLPTWCNDYDVLVEYTNCSPLTAVNTNDAQVGTGGGLFVNKGPVYVDSGTGLRHAVFQINSMSDSINIEPNRTQSSIIENDGDIRDNDSGNFTAANQLYSRLYQFLSYSVVLPQFRQTRWDMRRQIIPPGVRRYAPKTGAAYYPTVKFTIIGYKSSTFSRNTNYTTGNNYTLIQNIINGQGVTNLLGGSAPITSPSQPSLIDIQSVT